MVLPDSTWRPLDGDPVDLVGRVTMRARLHPDLAAVVEADGDELTYRDLLDRAWALAPTFAGCADERGVVVLAERGATSAVGLVAAAIAGRPVALVGVDEPADRIEALVERLGLPVVSAVDHVPEHVARAAGLDEDASALRCDPGPSSGDPVLLVSTTGSTSDPKVALVRSTRWRTELSTPESSRCQVLSAGVGSYAHVNILVTTMWRGGTAVAVDVQAGAVGSFVEAVRRTGVTKLTLTPTLIRLVHKTTGGLPLSTELQHVNLRGERSSNDDVQLCRALAPAASVFQVYGSTEAGPIAYTARRPGEPADGDLSLLEQVFDGVELLAADDRAGGALRPVAPGITGELLVHCDRILEGYVGRSDDDLFADHEGRRFVRTGDRILVEGDGRFRVLGRLGRRVKVAGMFVDLDEVAARFESYPTVDRAAVTAFDDDGGVVRLVAHLVPVPGREPDAVALRAALARTMPVHAVPSIVRFVDDPPTNRSGKLDHLVLGEWRPDAEVVSGADLVRVTAGPLESALLGVAASLLGRPVELDTDLVTAGFSSLDWLELVEQIRVSTGASLEVLHLFEQPTVRGIALRASAGGEPAAAVRVAVGDRTPAVFWALLGLAAQEALPLARALAGRSLWIPVPNGFARPGRRALSVGRIVADMDTALPIGDPPVVVGFSTGCVFAQELAARLERRGLQVPLLVLLDPITVRRRVGVVRRAKRTLREVSDRALLRLGRGSLESRHRALFRVQANIVRRSPRRSPFGGPTIVVRSEQHRTMPLPTGIDPSAHQVVLPGTSHHDVITDGALLARLVETSLGSADSGVR